MTDCKKKDRKFDSSLFRKPKSKRIARAVSIKSPTAFRRSIRTLRRGRYTLAEQRALQLAKNRAAVQLRRRNLSVKERRQFEAIQKIRVPRAKRD